VHAQVSVRESDDCECYVCVRSFFGFSVPSLHTFGFAINGNLTLEHGSPNTASVVLFQWSQPLLFETECGPHVARYLLSIFTTPRFL